MGFLVLVVAVVWSWRRIGAEDEAVWRVRGLGASLFWLSFAIVVTLGTFSFALWIVMVPLAVAMLVAARAVEPTRAWLLPVVFGAAPAAWIASGAIDADGAWLAACLALSGFGLALGVVFELARRERRSAVYLRRRQRHP